MKIKTKLTFQFTILISGILLLTLTLIYSVVNSFLIADVKEKFEEEVFDFQNSFKIENYNIISVDMNYGEWEELHHTLNDGESFNSIQVAVFDKNQNLLANSENFDVLIDFKNYLFDNEYFKFLDAGNIFYYSNPILIDGKICGWILLISQNLSSTSWLSFLRIVLSVSFLFGIIIAFYSSNIMASNSLSPISEIIRNTKKNQLNNFENKLPISKNDDELDELSMTLNDLIEKINYSLHRMKQFTVDVSHEMRTPLTIIKGEIEVTLNRERTVEEYQKTLKNCEEEIDRLSRIINNLLEIVRAEENKDNYEMTIVDLKKIIKNVISKFSVKLQKENLSLESNLESNCQIIGDEDKLTEIFFNLIENAIKYTEKGKIFVKLKKENERIIATISDTGIGIPKEDLNAIFERFYQSQKNNISGTGLGLNIVKNYVEKQNGKISVESQIGKGSEFAVSFPKIILD